MTSNSPLSAAEVADQFGRTSKRLARSMDEALVSYGVTTPRARFLAYVATNGPLRLNIAASEVGITQGTASELAEALVRDGLLVRHPDPSDRRATLLRATERGTSSANLWRGRYEQAAGELFSALDESERRMLVALLLKLDAGQ